MKRYLIITLIMLFAFSSLVYGARGGSLKGKKGSKSETVALSKDDKALVEKALSKGFNKLSAGEKDKLKNLLSQTYGIERGSKNSGNSNK